MKDVFSISIISFFLVTLLGCSADKDDRKIHDKAIHIASEMDSASLILLRQYSFGKRGPLEFWSRDSEGTALYTLSYRNIDDTDELNLSRPFDFKKDFPTSFSFDTSHYYQYRFLRVRDSIIKLKMDGYGGQEFFKDTAISARDVFPVADPFEVVKRLNYLKEKFGFIGTWYRCDIGDFINFWLTPYDKLIYIPDTNKMNPKSKRYWIEEFLSGKEVKKNWRLIRVKTND